MWVKTRGPTIAVFLLRKRLNYYYDTYDAATIALQFVH